LVLAACAWETKMTIKLLMFSAKSFHEISRGEREKAKKAKK
jgi:hypothetical protein